jgi:cysteine desulfurase
MPNIPIYLDCNATTPIDPRVKSEVIRFLDEEFGNAASRTHSYGTRAKQAVQKARDQVAEVVKAKRDEVVFTSGATESNNLAIMGLAGHGDTIGHKHIISTLIEHKAVLEPLEYLAKKGFEITLLPPNSKGFVEPEAVKEALRDDTLLVSVMQVNNETGVIQPITDICKILGIHSAFFHVDAAQGFGKVISPLGNNRIDLISISGHKIFAPKGVGALITRRRGFKRLPLAPIMYGGGHERGLRPGTLPVHLIVGLGLAAELAVQDNEVRKRACLRFREKVLTALKPLNPLLNGDPEKIIPHVLNISFLGLDSEAAIVALKDKIAISNGSACTSQSYEPSHVLAAMGLSVPTIQSALRVSWCHTTEEVDWNEIACIIKGLM